MQKLTPERDEAIEKHIEGVLKRADELTSQEAAALLRQGFAEFDPRKRLDSERDANANRMEEILEHPPIDHPLAA